MIPKCGHIKPLFLSPDRMEDYAWIVQNLRKGARTAVNAIRHSHGNNAPGVIKALWIYLKNKELYLKTYKAQSR